MSNVRGKKAAAKAAAERGLGLGYQRGLPARFEPGDAAIIRLMFEARAAGAEIGEIVKLLNKIT